MTTTLAEPRPTAPDAPAAPAVAAVRLTGLVKAFDERTVLDRLDLELGEGQWLALLGANGAGKSTLLDMLAMLTFPTAGELAIFGRAAGPRASDLRALVGVIGHQPMTYRDLTAIENLRFFGQLYGVADPDRRARELLERVGLAERADDPVATFSRGMSQRLAIARALVHEPRLLLADEPFAGLDVAAERILIDILKNLHAAGQTLIVTDHDIHRSLRLADRAVTLRGGQIVIDEPATDDLAERIIAEVSA